MADHVQMHSRYRSPGAVVLAAVLSLVALPPAPAAADHGQVTAVAGSALGYHADDISLFGGPQPDTGPTPTVSLASDASNSPQSASQAQGVVIYGPATLFTSGEITVSTEGSLGANGYVTSTALVDDLNRGGSEVFDAASVESTCTVTAGGVVTASSTITNGVLRTHAQGDQADTPHGEEPVAIPTNPEINHTVEGHLHIGATEEDNFRYVFNEQIQHADGSVTVNAVHAYLLGPTARGDLIVGQSVCGLSVEDLDHEPGALAGTVTDADSGVAVAGATVTAAGQTTTTATNGTYTIDGVEVGGHTVTATADGYVSASHTAAVSAGGTTIVDFTLQPGAGGIAGTVTDTESGDPIVGATVTTDGTSSATDDGGNYLFGGLAPGEYTVTADAEGYTSESLETTVVTDETRTLDFALRAVSPDEGEIAGTVTSLSDGSPIAGAAVTATRGAQTATATTQSDGTYTIEELDAGVYAVTAVAPGYRRAGGSVRVTDGETSVRDVALQPVGTVAGTVTDAATGNPIAGATVTSGAESTTTGADGKFTIPDRTVGQITVTATADGYVQGSQTVTVTRGQTATADFALAPVDTATGSVAGNVTNASTGEPIAGATVTATGSDSPPATAATAEDGTYEIADLDPGDYTVSAIAAGYEQASQDVTVEAGERTFVDLALDEGLGATEPPPALEALCPADPPTASFIDRDAIPEAHRRSVDCAALLDIVRGFADQTYGAALQVRRDQMASFILRSLEAAGVDLPPAGGQRFADVEVGSTHEQAVHRLAAAGIVLGGPGGLPTDFYGPALRVRRDQMASFLIRAAEYATEQRFSSPHQAFTDVTPDNRHFTNVNGAAAAGVAQGYGGGIYQPGEFVLRGQMSSFLVRLITAVAGDGD